VTGKKVDFNLYLITDRKLFPTNDLLLAGIEDALRAGVKAIQLREKDLATRTLLDMAYRMRELTMKYNALFFINDRVDIAMCVRSDGVHLGQTSIPVHAVRELVGDKVLIGASTHSLDEALNAEKEGADFVTFGPVYHTPSKSKYGEPVGTEALKTVRKKITKPVFGIGGIKPGNVAEVMKAGADGIAVISGILGLSDVKVATKKYVEELKGR
jgi:thiamine-phosphate pyrophosphorylase